MELNQEFEEVEIGKLKAHPRNPRNGNTEAIKESIEHNGFYGAVIAQRSTGYILAGNHRWKAAKEAGASSIPVAWIDVEEEHANRIMLADNRTNDLAGYNESDLTALLVELNESVGLDGTGYTEKDLDELLGELSSSPAEGNSDPDEIPEEVEQVCEKGDIWQLGNHRLMCGDCRDPDDVNMLMGGRRINIAFTSPPYASQRAYDESSGFEPIHPDKFVKWFERVQYNVKENLEKDGSWFVNIKPSCDGIARLTYVFDLVLAHVREWGWNYAEEFCWERTGIPQQVVRRFKNQFEPIYQFTLGKWKIRPESVRHESDSVPQALGKGAGDTNAAKRQGVLSAVEGNEILAGMAYPGNRLSKFKSEALGHPAAFPVGLPCFFIKAFSDENDAVYDAFCGSGSTVIASEQTNRKCYGMEISRSYCDLTIKRWEEFTDRKAFKVTG